MTEEKSTPKFYEAGYEKHVPKSWRVIAFEYFMAAILTLAAALLCRWAVGDVVQVRVASMQQTLQTGDFVCLHKIGYGLHFKAEQPPVLKWRHPRPGKLYVFTGDDRSGDYSIKRCVACGGQTLEIQNKKLYVDGEEFIFPGTREEPSQVVFPAVYSPRDNFPSYRVPRKGDTLYWSGKSLVEQEFVRRIIEQENPGPGFRQQTKVSLNGRDTLGFKPLYYRFDQDQKEPDYNELSWIELQNIVNFVRAQDSTLALEFRRQFYLGGKPLQSYVVKTHLAFFLGDNWDNSNDSRYQGPVSSRYIVGRPLFVLFSREPATPGRSWLKRIRFRRILTIL